MPFCVGCGVRVEAGTQRCPACSAKAAARRSCVRCGRPEESATARFCVACGAAYDSGPVSAPAGPAPIPRADQVVTRDPARRPVPVTADPAGPASTPTGPSAAERPAGTGSVSAAAALVQETRRQRQDVYQRLGRLLLAACYEGKLPFDLLPSELAKQARGGIESIRRGHGRLVQAGVCPRCLEPALSGAPPECGRCGLRVPAGVDGSGG